MFVTITVKVGESVAELANRMVKLGLARSRSNAINFMIGRVAERVSFREGLRSGFHSC